MVVFAIMIDGERTYCCIDLKSFYASVECVERGLDPFEARLVVADPNRTEKTICLAVSPALRNLGVPGRCRVFEIPDGVDYIMAKPRMRLYMEASAKIVGIYLDFVSAQDLHVYSIDECFIELTPYMHLYEKTAKQIVEMLCGAVFEQTGITATAGIGPNLFLAKVALDVTAKHAQDNIGMLDEDAFRERIWSHRPITDIWQIGRGTAEHLARLGIYDFGGVARADIDVMYREFGANAEYLIDHAWGVEPCTIAEIHEYQPKTTSVGSGQVLPCDYAFEDARMILREMVDECVFDLLDKGMVTGSVGLYVGYAKGCDGEGHASVHRKLSVRTNSFERLVAYVDNIFCKIASEERLVRRVSITFGGLVPEEYRASDLFSDVVAESEERSRQEAMLSIRQKFGNDAVMRGTSLKEKARGIERAHQIGGHNA